MTGLMMGSHLSDSLLNQKPRRDTNLSGDNRHVGVFFGKLSEPRPGTQVWVVGNKLSRQRVAGAAAVLH